MLKAGLTGGICSGKSQVSAFFESRHIPVIDADVIARSLLSGSFHQPQPLALHRLVAYFGNHILDQQGYLKRDVLRHAIFSEPKQAAQHKAYIDNLLHPLVYQKINQDVSQLAQQKLVIISIPLLIETADLSIFDKIIVVDCDPEEQIARCMQRDKQDERSLRTLINTQASRDQRLAAADYILDNNDNIDNLLQQCELLYQQLFQLAG